MLSLKLVVNAQKALAVVTTVAVCPQRGRENMQAEEVGTRARSPRSGDPCARPSPDLGADSPTPRARPAFPRPIPTTVRWVLAVMLVTTLVALHSHCPWSSLLRARNCRLPPGRALCLLLLGFPTLAKHGGGEEGGRRGREEEKPPTLRGPGRTGAAPGPSPQPSLPAPHPAPGVTVTTRPPPRGNSAVPRPCPSALPRSPGAQRYLPPRDDREGVPGGGAGDDQLPAGLLPVLPAW